MEKIFQLLGEAVLKNITISGTFGKYSVSDLVSLSLESLDAIYKQLKNKLSKYDTDSLLESKNTRAINKIQKQLEIVKAVFEYNLAESERLSNAIKIKVEKDQRLALLKEAKTKKELEAIKNTALEDLEKEIASLEEEV